RRAVGDDDDEAPDRLERDSAGDHARAGARAGNVVEVVRPGDDLGWTGDAAGDRYDDGGPRWEDVVGEFGADRDTRRRAAADDLVEDSRPGHGLRQARHAVGNGQEDAVEVVRPDRETRGGADAGQARHTEIRDELRGTRDAIGEDGQRGVGKGRIDTHDEAHARTGTGDVKERERLGDCRKRIRT